MPSDQRVLGIDGGGSKTVAWLAARNADGARSVVGRGAAGPANPQSVGFAVALQNLDRAIAAAFDDAQVEPGETAVAVLALAGSDRDETRQVLDRWATDRRLARRFHVVDDALPVLIAGSTDGWGVALIAGTGSLACGRDRRGRRVRAGGWGYLFGDEGSGYAIALAALRAAAKSADGRGPATELLAALLQRLDVEEACGLIPAVYRIADDSVAGSGGRCAAIASLATVVTEVAHRGDATALGILDDAAGELAEMVAAVARLLDFLREPFPLVFGGGMLLGSERLQDGVATHLNKQGLHPAPITKVPDPVSGAVELAWTIQQGSQ